MGSTAPDAPDRSFRLMRSEGPAAGVRRIAAGRVERAAERLREAQRGQGVADRVHGARKDLKRVRAVLRLVRHELGDDVYRAENDVYRQAGRLLSESRDAEVKLGTLEDVCARAGRGLRADAAEEWLAALREERGLAVESLGAGGSRALADALDLVEAGRGRIDAWSLRSEGYRLVGPGVGRAFKLGRRRMRAAAAEATAESFHEWRKRAKDLWYHLTILEGAASGKLAGRVEVAGKLSDALGEHHDLAVLRDDLLVRELPATDRATLVSSIAARQRELELESFRLGERLFAEKPKRFRRKMRTGWRAWKED